MLKTFFSGLEGERHCHQMGLAAGVEGEEEEDGGGRVRGRKKGSWLRRNQPVREFELSETQAF